MPVPEVRGCFLNNEYVPPHGRSTFDVVDPADGSRVGTVVRGTKEDAEAAMESAAAAQPEWERLGGAARGKVLLRAAERLRARADELARLMTREMGKVLYEARGEVAGAIDNLEYYPSFARTLSGEDVAGLPHGQSMRLLWVARGVVVAITPWNFPAATVTRKIAPALLGGNTMVLKPSSNTPLCAFLIAEALRDAGLPPGVLNVVPGPGGEVGPALIGHPACSTVTLTGSTASGIEVLRLAAPTMAKCLMELGGKAPVLVAEDADLDWAARATVWARFWNAGQSCIAAEKCYVDESVAPRFLQKLAALTKALRVGPGLSPGVDVGPLFSVRARDEVAEVVMNAEAQGGHLVVGGPAARRGALAKGAFYMPTLIDQVEDDHAIAREEIFGPVLPALTFSDWDDAIDRANHNQYGLSSYVFTRDVDRAEQAARDLKFGETYVNRVGPETPQGYHAGFRMSGLAGEGTVWGVRDYLQLKSVYVDWKRPHVADYFPPYPD